MFKMLGANVYNNSPKASTCVSSEEYKPQITQINHTLLNSNEENVTKF